MGLGGVVEQTFLKMLAGGRSDTTSAVDCRRVVSLVKLGDAQATSEHSGFGRGLVGWVGLKDRRKRLVAAKQRRRERQGSHSIHPYYSRIVENALRPISLLRREPPIAVTVG